MPERYETSFSVPFVQAWQRAGFSGSTKRHYTKGPTREAEAAIGIAYKGASIREHGKVATAERGVPVTVTVDCFAGAPKRWPAWLPRWMKPNMPFTKFPDVDNVCKVVLDGLNGIAYEDDRQVVVLRAEKHDLESGVEDRTDVTVAFETQ